MGWMKIAVISVCSMAFGITSYASGGVESIQAYLNHDFKFTLNNKTWVPKDSDGAVLTPVIINGTSYLPVKAVVEATGGEVQWNEATKSIAITSANGNEATISERERMIIEKINEIKEKLKLGLTKEKVKSLFREQLELADVNGDLENGSDSYWKYNFFKDPNYTGALPDHVPDEEGLKNKKIGANLFIGWKNNELYLYSISYFNPKANKVYMYLLNPDGSTSDSPINP
ncbi:copper amine oxidase N-terminal domain-containing protein [Paenibacillus sp. HWE-109]|uniref:stalk domain-containing protein n=1 Tax=Paenibacillus sp. HWE-109 TaxID=1306526 RepID=UPI001EDEB0B2|nr:stalk domain-containing protein [Paenibacillus sp. HWE-109]UKS29682.1 copper amine oxidase N-terminal domain-containing protein [Paenibacillus sp. HWE-109]